MATVEEVVAELTQLRADFTALRADTAATVIQIVTTNPAIANMLMLSQQATSVMDRVKALEAQRDNREPHGKSRIRIKEASYLKPQVWSGDKGSEPFSTLVMDIRVWAGALHNDMKRILDFAEREDAYLTRDDLDIAGVVDEEVLDDFNDLDRHLYQVLVGATKGSAKGFVDNVESSGFKAWKQLVHYYDPRTGADRSVAYGKVTQPVHSIGKAKNLDTARVAMQAWERELASFELKYGRKIDEDAKILALKSLMPDTLFGDGGAFRGRAFLQYEALRKTVVDDLDDKSINQAQKPVPMELGSLGVEEHTCRILETPKKEEAEAKDDEITREELFAMVRQFRSQPAGRPKGGGKGSPGPGGGGGSLNMNKQCWTCGEYGHLGRDCRQGGQQGKGNGQQGKGASKGGKGKGRSQNQYGNWGWGPTWWGKNGQGGWSNRPLYNVDEDGAGEMDEFGEESLFHLENSPPEKIIMDSSPLAANLNECRHAPVNCRNRFEALSLLDEDHEEEDAILTIAGGSEGKWVKEEAVVDSGAIDCVTNRKRFPHLKVQETAESRRGDTWSCAGGKSIKKEGQISLTWRTASGARKNSVFKVGAVSKTLVSVSRLHETGHDVILTKSDPKIVNQTTGAVTRLRRSKGMFILDMWIWVPSAGATSENEDVVMKDSMRASGFTRRR